jgi:hypothetical protein
MELTYKKRQVRLTNFKVVKDLGVQWDVEFNTKG